MKYCVKCGKELVDEAVVCPGCGCAAGNENSNHKEYASRPVEVEDTHDAPESSGLASAAIALSFISPIVGFILGLVGLSKYKTDRCRSRCRTAIILSVVVWIVCTIICLALMYA